MIKVGDMINVRWGKFGMVRARVEKISRTGTIYAARWNKRRGCWTKPVLLDKYVYDRGEMYIAR